MPDLPRLPAEVHRLRQLADREKGERLPPRPKRRERPKCGQAMHHVVVNRLTAMRGFDSRADEKSVMVSVVSDGGYDTMTLPLQERPAP